MNLLNFQLLLGNDLLTNFVDNMDVYFIMIVALAFLAIGDLVVGVSNDALSTSCLVIFLLKREIWISDYGCECYCR